MTTDQTKSPATAPSIEFLMANPALADTAVAAMRFVGIVFDEAWSRSDDEALTEGDVHEMAVAMGLLTERPADVDPSSPASATADVEMIVYAYSSGMMSALSAIDADNALTTD